MPYQDSVRERLFEPVGLTRVSFEPEPPAAKDYLAQPYADGVWDTIGVETGVWASAGQLWGTADDICRWRWRTVSGPECGELLRIVCAPDGSVERMVWAGYPVTREPGPWRAPE